LNQAVPNQIAAVVFVVAGHLTELVLALTFGAALGLLLLASKVSSSSTPDAREGGRAFAEKRKPCFQGL
jgi:hypothetical protein